jgi:hypothetical protein
MSLGSGAAAIGERIDRVTGYRRHRDHGKQGCRNARYGLGGLPLIRQRRAPSVAPPAVARVQQINPLIQSPTCISVLSTLPAGLIDRPEQILRFLLQFDNMPLGLLQLCFRLWCTRARGVEPPPLIAAALWSAAHWQWPGCLALDCRGRRVVPELRQDAAQ